ncbi:unnamed protein product [Leptosia nina]|uniref:Uncharacterized protein n=1 Tax=Leptosia nina TaxID=320188 RepID=A0AAV1JR67_9NEOP
MVLRVAAHAHSKATRPPGNKYSLSLCKTTDTSYISRLRSELTDWPRNFTAIEINRAFTKTSSLVRVILDFHNTIYKKRAL